MPAKHVATSGESSNCKWVKAYIDNHSKVQITKTFTTLNKETSTVNPHEAAPLV